MTTEGGVLLDSGKAMKNRASNAEIGPPRPHRALQKQQLHAARNVAGDAAEGSDLISIESVSKSYGSLTVLEDISFKIASGEFLILLGPSGCGKTTLLRMIGGFDYPSLGTISLDGENLAVLPPHKRPINTVFQSYALFTHMTVRENVGFGLRMLKWTKAQIEARVSEVLELVHLNGFDQRKPAQLSGGQQQRVALARALAPSPRLLLLDEPLSALDLKLRKEMQVELKRLQRETGITFVLVTHDQEEALTMADRVAVMEAGRMLQIGHPEEVYARPANRFVADFIGEANTLPGDALGRRGSILSLRPESIAITQSVGRVGRLQGRIVSVSFLGSDILYQVSHSISDAPLRVRVRAGAGERLDVGRDVGIDWADASEWWLHQ
jgi:spermidine/putrescine transport system ATP-binding protein